MIRLSAALLLQGRFLFCRKEKKKRLLSRFLPEAPAVGSAFLANV